MYQPNPAQQNPMELEQKGVFLDDLANGTVVEIDTKHHHYRLEKRDDTHVRISGHPTFCPEPVDVELEGSIGNQPPLQLKPRFIGDGMRLAMKHPVFDVITTSQIRQIHVI